MLLDLKIFILIDLSTSVSVNICLLNSNYSCTDAKVEWSFRDILYNNYAFQLQFCLELLEHIVMEGSNLVHGENRNVPTTTPR